MRGIDFTIDNIELTIKGIKTQTRRLSHTFKVGETVFLREPFYLDIIYDDYPAGDLKDCNPIVYYHPNERTGRKRNKRFMPAAFARNFITIINVKTEPLQSISLEDCKKEGVNSIDEYKLLFNSLHNNIWDSNPIIYVYDYIKK